jgi:ribonuclease P protein component
MLPKPNRLIKEKDFKKVARLGRRYFCPLFTLKIIENHSEYSRFAIIVSLRVSKKAFERNTLRRRFREILRPRLEQIKKGYDWLIILNPSAKSESYKFLEEEFEKVLKKTKLC